MEEVGDSLGGDLRRSGDAWGWPSPVGDTWGRLGVVWGHLGVVQGQCGVVWEHLRVPYLGTGWGTFGGSWGQFEGRFEKVWGCVWMAIAGWGCLGTVWGHLGVVWGQFGDGLGTAEGAQRGWFGDV